MSNRVAFQPVRLPISAPVFIGPAPPSYELLRKPPFEFKRIISLLAHIEQDVCDLPRDEDVLCFPTNDGEAPELSSIELIVQLIEQDPVPTYIHCMGGYGRTGTVASCLLIRSGMHSEEAMRRISILRERECPETHGQQLRVASYAFRLRQPRRGRRLGDGL